MNERRLGKYVVFVFFVSTLTCAFSSRAFAGSDSNDNGYMGMSLEQLMEVKISSATLTQTSTRLVPAAVTTITAEDIRTSGARSLFELLDIYVPNLIWLRQHYEGDIMGLRGIIGDRNDKYLLLVNGRNMNEKTHAGAVTEQDLVMLSDIHHIDVVRGPGSAMYGPGAVSMVINIVTFNSNTFQGTEVVTRTGAIEDFDSLEVKHGYKFKSGDGGIFVYAGVGKYNGASKYDAPQIFSHTFSTHTEYNWWPPAWGFNPFTAPAGEGPGDGIQAGKPVTNAMVTRDGAAAHDEPPLKFHIELTKDNWDFWVRYTKGGKELNFATESLARAPWGYGDWIFRTIDFGANTSYPKPWKFSYYDYEQLTGYIGHKQEISKTVDVDMAFSYSTTDFSRFLDNALFDATREDQYYGKLLMNWQPNQRHKFAIGAEITHMELGLKPLDGSVGEPVSSQLNPMPRWGTNLYSVLGEWQWNINDKWTTFVGARIDKHTFTDYMFSPRAAVVFTPNAKDTFKLMWSQSVRANFEENMKKRFDEGGGTSSPEKLDSIEFRYERQHNKNLDLAASIFVHYSLQAIAWNGSQSSISGTQREYGAELEATYHTEKTRLSISHGYTKLYGYYLAPGQTTTITAKPYGYGDDLTNWSNHITKVTFERKIDKKLTFDASLRIYWGFPGMKDYDKYNPYATPDGSSTGFYRGDPAFGSYGPFPVIEDGWEKTYRGSYFLNLGLKYNPTKNLTIGLNAYNVLGVLNRDFNKRNFVSTGYASGDYRSVAPAVAVTVAYVF